MCGWLEFIKGILLQETRWDDHELFMSIHE